MFNTEKLKKVAEGVRKQSERYGLPTEPKKKPKGKNKKTE